MSELLTEKEWKLLKKESGVHFDLYRMFYNTDETEILKILRKLLLSRSHIH